MKIYVSTSLKHRKELSSFFNALEQISASGNKIIDVYKSSAEESENVDAMVDRFKDMEKAIREADIVIVESTYPIRRSGFEIARAIDERKFVIAVYDEGVYKKAPGLLVGNTSKYFIHRPYNKDNAVQVLKDAMEEAKEHLDTKFILIISPEIDKYLQWASEERRLHKAQIVRNAIEDVMERDKDYKNYLKQLGIL